jgi:hypothetical protein
VAARGSNFRRWLDPAARQRDGSLWLPGRPEPIKATPAAPSIPLPKVSFRKQPKRRDPFTPAERLYLRHKRFCRDKRISL